MKINCIKKINSNLENDEFRVLIEYNSNSYFITNFENYINKYDSFMNVVIVKDKYNNYIHINKEDIVYFSSDKKVNYCKTMDNQYVINKKLYEIEKLDKEYLRISKNCIVNIRQIECFDMSKTGNIIIRLNDGSEKKVSRRKIREIYNYLDERKI